MSAGYTNLRTVSYRDTIAELIARANQTHTRATGVQVFAPGDGMAYEDTEGFLNPVSPALFDDAKSQIAEASESLVAAEAELEAAQVRIDETTVLLGQLDEQATASAEQVAGVVKDMEADRTRLTAAQADLDALKPRLGDVEGAVSASDAKATQAVSDAAQALQEAQQAREYAEGLDPSTGDGSYSEAMQAAQAAARDALAAMERANLAVTSASGKSSVRNATSSPQGVGTAVGDTWFQWTSFPGGVVIGQWSWSGSAWVPVTLSHQVISSLDLGKATVGELDGLRIKAGSVTADKVLIGVGQNLIPNPNGSTGVTPHGFYSGGVRSGVKGSQTSTVFYSAAQVSGGSWGDAGLVRSGATTANGRAGDFVIDPRIPYLVRFNARVESGSASARVRASVWSPEGTLIRNVFAPDAKLTSSWQTVSATLTAEMVAGAASVSLSLQQTRNGAEVWYDGLDLRQMADAVSIADGAITAPKVNAESVAGALGQFIKVQAENVEVTDTLAARVLSAARAEVAEAFITDRLVVGTGDDRTVLEVLGTAVVNDLNLRGTLRGRDAILDGTLDVEQLRVTGDMAAEIGRYMRLETKKLIVTEDAVMQHVTAIEGIITPKIDAAEGRFNNLLAAKASIADLAAGNLTLTGNFRSGAVGKPGVIIPQNYTTQAGMEQLGVWLAPDGKAPSLGSEWGRTAGMWLDNASNVAGSTNSSPLFIRGQAGAGVRVMGGLSVGNSAGNALITPVGGGGNVVISARLGDADLSAGRYATLVGGSTANVITPGDLYLKGSKSIRLTDTADNPYAKSWTGGGLKTVYMGGSSGIVYTETSTARAKVDIETAEPDHEWLDMRTVTYRDRIAVELQAEIEARRAAGDCTPLTAEEHERLAIADRRVPGRIAEEGVGVADAQVVLDGSGQVEGWDYSRDAVMLTPHVREHRDKIADLESRIAELESAFL